MSVSNSYSLSEFSLSLWFINTIKIVVTLRNQIINIEYQETQAGSTTKRLYYVWQHHKILIAIAYKLYLRLLRNTPAKFKQLLLILLTINASRVVHG